MDRCAFYNISFFISFSALSFSVYFLFLFTSYFCLFLSSRLSLFLSAFVFPLYDTFYCFFRPFCPSCGLRGFHFSNSAGLSAVYFRYFILMNTTCRISIHATMKNSLITNKDAALLNEVCCSVPIVAACSRLLKYFQFIFENLTYPFWTLASFANVFPFLSVRILPSWRTEQTQTDHKFFPRIRHKTCSSIWETSNIAAWKFNLGSSSLKLILFLLMNINTNKEYRCTVLL